MINELIQTMLLSNVESSKLAIHIQTLKLHFY
nr:MAG TPA: hypothetical protein [Caudoviricetes sp.]